MFFSLPNLNLRKKWCIDTSIHSKRNKITHLFHFQGATVRTFQIDSHCFMHYLVSSGLFSVANCCITPNLENFWIARQLSFGTKVITSGVINVARFYTSPTLYRCEPAFPSQYLLTWWCEIEKTKKGVVPVLVQGQPSGLPYTELFCCHMFRLSELEKSVSSEA